MLSYVGSFLVFTAINFVVLEILARFVVGWFMKFLGADAYTFNVKKRAIVCGAIAAVLAIVEIVAVGML